MYPHQVLMEQQGLTRNDLSTEAKGYLTDYHHQHRGIEMKRGRAEKAGKEFVLSPEDDAKLQRLSKSVCVQIYQDFNTNAKKLQQEKEREDALKREAEELKLKQEEEDKRIQEEIELKKKQLEEEELRKEELKKNPPPPPPPPPPTPPTPPTPPEEKKEESDGGNIFDYFF